MAICCSANDMQFAGNHGSRDCIKLTLLASLTFDIAERIPRPVTVSNGVPEMAICLRVFKGSANQMQFAISRS